MKTKTDKRDTEIELLQHKHAKAGSVTLIQRFGSALNLNIHFHMLFLEGALSEDKLGNTKFTRIKAPIVIQKYCHT